MQTKTGLEPRIVLGVDATSPSAALGLRSDLVHRTAFRLLTGSTAPPFDAAKLWDVVNVEAILRSAPRTWRVLDCGAFNSPCTRLALRLGFRDVHGIDLNPALPAQHSFRAIGLTVQDMQATAFCSETFDVVLSCSTVEHGVSWPRFLAEARRLLRPGGVLYVSTDLVHGGVDTSGLEAFGLPWQPLESGDLPTIAALLREHGFDAPEPVEVDLPEALPFSFLGHPVAFVAFVAVKRA